MKSEADKQHDRRLLTVFGGGALLFLAFYFIIVAPRGAIYRHKLQSLRPEQVRKVRIHSEKLVNDEIVTKERILKSDDVPKFLTLISEATSYRPNHPRGGWTVFVDMETTTDIPRFTFLIHSTSNNGVHFNLFSDPNGKAGWSYGTLRNDELGPFIEGVFRAGQ